MARARRDPGAFHDVYAAYGSAILRFIRGRVRDRELAHDLAADTFLHAFLHRRQFRGSTAAGEQAWLYAIARSRVSHFHRRTAAEARAVARLAVLDAVSASEDDGGDELAARVPGAAARLPGDQRRAVELRVIEELGYPVAAERLGVSEQVVRARVSRGLRALATLLADEAA